MINMLSKRKQADTLATSSLFNEDTFYDAFNKDLKKCHSELIIESPYITNRRLQCLLPALIKLKQNRVRIVINTKDPIALHDIFQVEDTYRALASLQQIRIQIVFTVGHHRKLVVIDRKIMYEGCRLAARTQA